MSIAVPADVTAVVSRFLYSTLKNDADLITIGSKGVSNRKLPSVATQAQRDALYPRVLFYFEATLGPSYGGGGHIRWELMRYAVVGIGLLSQEAVIEQIAARARALLHVFSGDVEGGGNINSCAYDGAINRIEPTGEDDFLRIGARWKIKVRLSSSQ